MSREVLQMALDALVIGFKCAVEVQFSTKCSLGDKRPLLCKELAGDVKQIEDAMAALRAELAKPEQEDAEPEKFWEFSSDLPIRNATPTAPDHLMPIQTAPKQGEQK